MRPRAVGLGLVLWCAASPALAQRGPEPTMILTLFGGVTTGHRLWRVARQPLCVIAPNGSCSSQFDTLDLQRDVTSNVVFGASGVYFTRSHLGIEGEVFYLGLPFDDSCHPVYINPAPNPPTQSEQVCLDISAASPSTSAIAFYGGLVFRASPRHAISPYARVGLGLVTYSGGTIEMSGAFDDGTGNLQSRAVLIDARPKTSSFSLQTAVGMTTRITPGYQFRLEIHDALIPLQRPAGPAGTTLQPPKATHAFHHLILTMGLDVVLEKKRGRRY